MEKISGTERMAGIERKTGETIIDLKLSLDGSGTAHISTGVGFLDHMLNLFARHGLFDLTVDAQGDLDVDFHHTVEDVGIVLGQALKAALGDKHSIVRYGTEFVPMDESLASVTLDLGGRPYLIFDAAFPSPKIGEFDTELVEEFFRAVSFNAGMNLHMKVHYGNNSHHMAEALFKAFARALDKAVSLDTRIHGVMSTKGVI